ncbi:MAG: hypothetical protein HY774_09090 [Acidobacteria bacterium]|nr:hypothetical protein [Acidobacteriota bacterium]
MQVRFRRKNKSTKWHILHAWAMCLDAIYLGLAGDSIFVFLDSSDLESPYCFTCTVEGKEVYIAFEDICGHCRRSLFSRLKLYGEPMGDCQIRDEVKAKMRAEREEKEARKIARQKKQQRKLSKQRERRKQ